MNDQIKDAVLRMAWEDRTTFEEIEKRFGLNEAAVIRIMRQSLKPSGFRMWRRRVSGRITKHRKTFEARRAELKPSAWRDEVSGSE
ncbi:MAG: TIGR03643 family protein [Armatimonadetes bacterium]|nr:TIGR03643 family protein [Akkermansiaceae bacterium]